LPKSLFRYAASSIIITPNVGEEIEEYDEIEFVQKNSGQVCQIPVAAIKGFLSVKVDTRPSRPKFLQSKIGNLKSPVPANRTPRPILWSYLRPCFQDEVIALYITARKMVVAITCMIPAIMSFAVSSDTIAFITCPPYYLA
jgi:hypothetical protein